MNLLNDLYISKSFCWLGQGLDKCFNCKYCRAKPLQNNKAWNVLPTKINPIFTNLPIVINLFYGDPLLQINNTKKYLELLEKENHKAPVIIITKGKLSDLGELNYNLNLHIALSTIGRYHTVDKVSWCNFLENVNYIYKHGKSNIVYSCEFRPIMYGINDKPAIIDTLFEICKEIDLPIGYSGLQGTPEMINYWKDNYIDLKPFPGYDFTIKKPISNECKQVIQECSTKHNVPVFKKTSCLISYSHNLDRDYNSHYYRPNEMNCNNCIMKNKCFEFKNNLSLNQEQYKNIIPFDFTIQYKENHQCLLYNTCPHPHSDCTKIKGNLININDKVTTADVRIIKWLTGYTVATNFIESNYISEKWKVK